MIKYYAIKVFVTDGKAEKNAEEQKNVYYRTVGAELPLWGRTALLYF